MSHKKSFLNELKDYIDFGHKKVDDSVKRQISQYIDNPQNRNYNTASGAMAAYRFAKNDNINLEELRELRTNFIKNQFSQDDTILAIHDVSLLNYYDHNSKDDRRPIGDGEGKGYEYVCNLAVSLEDEAIKGVLHDTLVNSEGPDDTDFIDYHEDDRFATLSQEEPERLECNHKHQLVTHAEYIKNHFQDRKIIITGDREFDDSYFFEKCEPGRFDTVIRSNALRNVQINSDNSWVTEAAKRRKYTGLPLEDGYVCASMPELIKEVPTTKYKELPVDQENRVTTEKRAERWVQLSVGSFKIKLYRDAKRNKKYFSISEHIDLNVVVVKEDSPPKGEEPVLWVLYTTLPANTEEEIHKIVHIYELRWLIENYFKYLKSGYKVERLRYNNAEKIAKHLVPISLAVTFIFLLKSLLGLDSGSYLDDLEYERLKIAKNNMNDKTIDFNLRLFAFISISGGWLGRRNDPISPMVLMNGVSKLFFLIKAMNQLGGFIKELLQYES